MIIIIVIREKIHTFVPKSVSAIAILFLAISKLGEIVKHLQYSKIMQEHINMLLL